MPSSHSSSSHSSSSSSSSSHSSGSLSSHSSSSHSSSSWSSSGSSWGSSRSSASRSSGSTPSAFYTPAARARSSARAPSSHSRTSHSSPTIYRSHYVRSGSMRGTIIDRKRYNQPQGYMSGAHYNIQPVTHFCLRHNYLYYPFNWTDEATGREYRKGYYDENGQYYENVVFRSDGVYKDVVCQCEFCGTVTKLDWSEGGPLICPQCGGTMKLLSTLDEYTRDPLYNQTSRQPNYVDYADRDNYSGGQYGGSQALSDGVSPAKALLVVFAVFVGMIMLIALFAAAGSFRGSPDPYETNHLSDGNWIYLGNGVWGKTSSWNNQNGSDGHSLSNPEIFGSVIRLKLVEPGVCVMTDDDDCDLKLIWDESEESYYDEDSDLWVWYNTDVEPNIWQYWYEPISGNYGDYGWMEYDCGEEAWFIETDQGVWSKVQESYDVSPLWHIADQLPAEDDDQNDDETDEDLSALELFGTEIYLIERVPGIFRISDENDFSRVLVWDDDEQCYYEESSGLWAWYNTDVKPNIWQYWYEPISGDYDGYGWMEYENEVWYIEISQGQWIEVPENCDVSSLWHIETDE